MAVFRKINISFWEDVKVVDDFTPEDKYFMLYLMTNPHTNQAGCYSITMRQMEFETGYNRDTIEKLIKRFTDILKVIDYSNETKEIFILNWSKYNWSNSPKVIACIQKEAETIKNSAFRYSINTLLKEYLYSSDTETQKEKEKEEEQEEEIKKEEEKNLKEETKEQKEIKALEKLQQYKNPDLMFDKKIDEVFKLYKNKCPNLCPLVFEERNIERRQQVKDLLILCRYDFGYIEGLFNRANEQITFYDEKINFQSLIKNHEKIYQGIGAKKPEKKETAETMQEKFAKWEAEAKEREARENNDINW